MGNLFNLPNPILRGTQSEKMHKNNYIYSFKYDKNESDLCKLESRSIFGKDEQNKLLFSDIKVEPSSSAFIRKRLDIITFSDDYEALISKIKNETISVEGFKAEYLVLDGDTTEYAERLKKLKDIGYCIEGTPDYYSPTITYALSHYQGVWYFGIVIKDTYDWFKHKEKPRSFSNSISINIAKALVNIASKTNKGAKLLDTCCGAGTIMLEACFNGNRIEGCDINWKMCRHARENLSHFNYTANVYRSDIKDIHNRYDAAIIDLPYNLFSNATDNDLSHIIVASAEIAKRLVIVSTTDITSIITNSGLNLLDYCSIKKTGKAIFTRKIWVCEKK